MNSGASSTATRHLFKPSHRSSARSVSLWIALPLAALYLLPAYSKLVQWYVSSIVAIAILAGSVVLVLGLIWILTRAWRANSALQVGEGFLVYESWGHRRSWPLSNVARLVRGNVLVQMLQAPSYSREQLMFIDNSGRCFLRLGPSWAHTRIAHVVGVQIEPTPADVVTAGDAARVYPGSYSWLIAHPLGRLGLVVASGIVLFGLIIGFIALRG